MKENTETSSHPILDTRIAKLIIEKSSFEGFIKSVYVCVFYGVIILLVTMILSANYGESTASAAVGFVAVLGVLATVPVGIVYFVLLALGRALRRIKILSNLLRKVALICFFIIPYLLVL